MAKRKGTQAQESGDDEGEGGLQSTELRALRVKRGKLDDAEDERAHELLLALQRRSKSMQETCAAKTNAGLEAVPAEASPRLISPKAATQGDAKVT